MSATAAAADHGDHHGPIEVPEDPQYGVASPGKLAMWFFLLSDGFSFGGLLLTYGIESVYGRVERGKVLRPGR